MPRLDVLAALLLSLDQDPLVARVRQTAYARMDLATSMARDPAVVGYVVSKNVQQETAADIQKRDARWRAGGEGPLRKELTTGPCAERLRTLVKADAFVLEVILMDARGALVCATAEPTDYWQGDEAKWQKPMQAGLPAFVDEPAFDASTQAYALQLSVPVTDTRRRVGALTLTLKVPRPTVAR